MLQERKHFVRSKVWIVIVVLGPYDGLLCDELPGIPSPGNDLLVAAKVVIDPIADLARKIKKRRIVRILTTP